MRKKLFIVPLLLVALGGLVACGSSSNSASSQSQKPFSRLIADLGKGKLQDVDEHGSTISVTSKTGGTYSVVVPKDYNGTLTTDLKQAQLVLNGK
jgi:hypothetical protein